MERFPGPGGQHLPPTNAANQHFQQGPPPLGPPPLGPPPLGPPPSSVRPGNAVFEPHHALSHPHPLSMPPPGFPPPAGPPPQHFPPPMSRMAAPPLPSPPLWQPGVGPSPNTFPPAMRHVLPRPPLGAGYAGRRMQRPSVSPSQHHISPHSSQLPMPPSLPPTLPGHALASPRPGPPPIMPSMPPPRFPTFLPPSGPPALAVRAPMPATRAEDDLAWAERWLTARAPDKPGTGQEATAEENAPSISDCALLLAGFQDKSDAALDGLSELQRCITYETPEAWDARFAAAVQSCHGLATCLSGLADANVGRLAGAVQRRRAKRRRLKERRRLRWESERGPAATQRRDDLHRRVDEWRARRIAADISRRHEASLRDQAGGALGEVRKKQLDAARSLQLLAVLGELHDERRAALRREGVDVAADAEAAFAHEAQRLRDMWARQQSAYADEEQLLKVMLEEEKEEEVHRQMEKAKRSAKLRDEEKRSAPDDDPVDEEPAGMELFRSFYMQASGSVEQFLGVRRQWELFTAPEITGDDVSIVPDGWPSPPSTPTEPWKTFMS